MAERLIGPLPEREPPGSIPRCRQCRRDQPTTP